MSELDDGRDPSADQVKQGTQSEAELSERELDEVAGGLRSKLPDVSKLPPPSGPIPIPYPNVT